MKPRKCARSFPHTPYAHWRALARPCADMRQCPGVEDWRALARVGALISAVYPPNEPVELPL